MTIKDLKEKLNKYLEVIDEYDDNTKVKTYSNSYWVGNEFLCVPEGFVDLKKLEYLDDNEDY